MKKILFLSLLYGIQLFAAKTTESDKASLWRPKSNTQENNEVQIRDLRLRLPEMPIVRQEQRTMPIAGLPQERQARENQEIEERRNYYAQSTINEISFCEACPFIILTGGFAALFFTWLSITYRASTWD